MQRFINGKGEVMTLLDIYIIGVVSSFLIGLVGLTYTTNKRCNITKPECALFANGLVSILSWISVAVLIGGEIYERRNNDKN